MLLMLTCEQTVYLLKFIAMAIIIKVINESRGHDRTCFLYSLIVNRLCWKSKSV